MRLTMMIWGILLKYYFKYDINLFNYSYSLFSSFCTQGCRTYAVDYPVYPEESSLKLLLLKLQNEELNQEFL